MTDSRPCDSPYDTPNDLLGLIDTANCEDLFFMAGKLNSRSFGLVDLFERL